MSDGSERKDKIRVGFILNFSGMWLGGVNYYNNLFKCLAKYGSGIISPVVFTDQPTADKLRAMHGDRLEIVVCDFLTRRTFSWFIERVINRLFGRMPFLSNFVKKHHVDVLSHFYGRANFGKLKTIAWIPDFQHIHLKEMFSDEELKARDKAFINSIVGNDGIILSSYDAKKDLEMFKHEQNIKCGAKEYILQFAVDDISDVDLIDREFLLQKHNIEANYIYLPNQFWMHKNHKTVIEALNILKSKRCKVVVVSTGAINDYRNKQYFQNLQDLISKYGIEDMFVVLGQVSYPEVLSLMYHAKAVLNPSLFEGWSTTVEEAKMLNKRVILSDIGVHAEQNPPGAIYFNPHDSAQLAVLLQRVAQENEQNFHYDYEIQRRNTALTFEKIVSDTISDI